MAVITYEAAKDIVLPNITVERKYADGVQTGYMVRPNKEYVLYNSDLDVTYEDPDGNTIHERYYHRETVMPVQYPVSMWNWVAVLESDVPADMIV